MKISAAEHRMLDRLVEIEQAAAGPYGKVTRACYLRGLMLAEAAKKGLTREMFERPKSPRPVVPPLPSYQGPTAEAVRAAVERAVAGGVAIGEMAREAGIHGPRISEMRAGARLGHDEERLPALAAALARLGYPVE